MPVFSCGGMRYQQSWNARDLGKVTGDNQSNLEATIHRAFELGITHIETARGYGTSEAQLGRVLPQLDRERLIAQTKVAPERDARVFRRKVEESLSRLNLESVDLFALHGVNNESYKQQTLRPGGCLEEAERLRAEGKIRHIGFSTHAPTEFIVELIETGRFDYVNLHWYYIFQDNEPALAAAARQDMGVFIISPSDKGGMLYKPPEKLRTLCEPLSPMVFNDVFCLSRTEIHTLSIGAARPSDFDEHLKALALLDDPSSDIDRIRRRLDEAFAESLGAEYASSWRDGIPPWETLPGKVNVKTVLWLYNLARAFDLTEYARMRYKLLGGTGGHWFPGGDARSIREPALQRALSQSPHAAEIPELLRQAHALLWQPPSAKERIASAKRAVKIAARGVLDAARRLRPAR